MPLPERWWKMAENRVIDLYPILHDPNDLRELVARLVCMGATPPVALDHMTIEKAEEIVAGLPSLCGAHTRIQDRFQGEVLVWQFDITRAGAESRLVETLNDFSLAGLPEEHSFTKEYSPGAWLQFFHQDFQTVNQEILRDSFYCWDIDYEPERAAEGFSADVSSIISHAERLLEQRRQDLLARLACIGIISPLDYYECTPQRAEEIISGLPPLVDLEVILEQPGQPMERLHFINLAEFNFRSKTLVEIDRENDPNKNREEDDPRNNRFKSDLYPSYTKEMQDEDDLNEELNSLPDFMPQKVMTVTESEKSLQLQLMDFYDRNPGIQELCTSHRTTLKSGCDWIDYFNQDINSAIPTKINRQYNFSRLKKAFSSWEFNTAKETINWKAGFVRDFQKNREEARMIFFRSLFFKLSQVGIIPRFQKDEWFSMDADFAEKFAETRIPLLAEQEKFSDWLRLFNQPLPDDPMFLLNLKSSFEAAGIPFSREAVCSAFQKTTQKKGKEAMSINQENERKYLISAVRNMINRREMEPIPDDFLAGMSLLEVEDILRSDPKNKITDDQLFTLKSKEKAGLLKDVSLPAEGIAVLSRQEATFYIQNTPRLNREQMMPEHPATEETRNLFTWLTRDKPEFKISSSMWPYVSEEELQIRIQNIQAKMKISDFQNSYLNQCLENGTFPINTAKKYINLPVIGPEQIEKLNYYQAMKIVDDCPISEKQLENFRNMSDNHPLKPANPENFSYKEARELWAKVTMRGKTLADTDPICDNDIAAIKDILEANPQMKLPKPLAEMSHGEARSIIANQEPSEAQIRKIGYLIRETNTGNLIPDFVKNSLKRGQASEMIDILVRKDRHGNINTAALQELVEKIDPPASDEQLAILKQYQEQGAKIKIPKNPTYRQLDKLIAEEHGKQPISNDQLENIKTWVARGTVDPAVLKRPEKLTQARFGELRMVHMQNQRKQNSMAPSPEQAKAPEVSGMSR